MANHEMTAQDRSVSAAKVLFAILVLIVLGVSAVLIFGYAGLIVLALAGTATVLVTLVVMTAGG